MLQYGIERFADALVAAGACGAIVPDVPLEETDALRKAFAPRGLALPLLIAPTTPPARAAAIAAASEGFVYLVSRLGVTSASKEPDFAWIAARVAALRGATALPLAIGFGISSAEHIRRAYEIADGAIVGSALIDAYAGTDGEEAVARVRAFLTRLGGAPGVYNIVDDDPAPVAEWLPYLAGILGAKPPLRVPAWLGRPLAGELVVAQMTSVRGSANLKAKKELGWEPRYASWREGFSAWAGA